MTRDWRALTVRQPMAHAIAAGVKIHENRPRRMLAPERFPRWVALHAGQGYWPAPAWHQLWADYDGPALRELPRGVILGVMRLDWMREYPTSRPPQLGRQLVRTAAAWAAEETDRAMLDDPWASGPWCLRVGMYLPLSEPVPAKGMLGFWRVHDVEAVARLDEVLDAVQRPVRP